MSLLRPGVIKPHKPISSAKLKLIWQTPPLQSIACQHHIYKTVNPLSAKFQKVHLEMEWVDL